ISEKVVLWKCHLNCHGSASAQHCLVKKGMDNIMVKGLSWWICVEFLDEKQNFGVWDIF
ncbi:hypothetical protein PIB30_065157, partial [Stylosanthes scabra]|nr:hypothetical protein [Stylosanthes scabra]